MPLFNKKPITVVEPSESTVRLLKNNLSAMGLSLPLKDKDIPSIVKWLTAQQERCTEKECTIEMDNCTPEEIETALREFNPYNDSRIDLSKLNKALS